MNQYSPTREADRSRSGFVNALLGAVLMVVFSWIPFAPVIGGALSGYLEAGDRNATGSVARRGVRVGALAGLLAAIPALLVVALVGSAVTVGWVGLVAAGGGSPGVALGLPVLAWAVVGVALVVGVLYHVAFSALGGWLGAELAARDDRRFDDTRSATHRTTARDPRPAHDTDESDEAVEDDFAPERDDRTEH